MPSDIDPLFRSGSVAIIGANRRPGTLGYQIVDNLLRHGYQGVVYPVNPRVRSVHSIPAFASVGAIADEVDLAVVVVPGEHVLEVVDECHVREMMDVNPFLAFARGGMAVDARIRLGGANGREADESPGVPAGVVQGAEPGG